MKSRKQTLTKLANAAFKQAAQKVIERSEQTGTPVIVWENGAIKEIWPKSRKARSRKRKPPRKA